MFTLESGHRIFSQVGLFPLLILSTLDCAHFLFNLLGNLSIWDFIFFNSVHSNVCPHDEILTKDCVHSWFCPNWTLLTFGSVYVEVCPGRCLPTLIRSTWESGLMKFCQRRIVYTIGSVNSEFFSLLVLSTWDYVHRGLLLIGFLSTLHSFHLVLNRFWNCLLGKLATWHFAQFGLYPLLVRSTLNSSPFWFCLLGIMSIEDFF